MTTESNGKSGDRNPQLHRAVAALQQMRAKLVAAERRRNEPIAIIGLWCRFPRAGSPEAFWDLLRRGEDAVTEIPADRWDVNAYYDPDPDCPGRAYTRHGAFLSDVDCFDAGFFGIAPREAQSLDPQQRILLEVVWHALENAGIAASEVPGARTGVFVGITSSDYSRLLDTHDTTAIDPYIFSGNALNFAAGRISHTFNLRGPSLAIDTACSSSLVAVHLACQSLRAGECNLALAGGVNLVLAPDGNIAACKLKMLSPDGRCKTFDARADGYGRGEGCGIIVLERLSEAVSSGRSILAVIRGSAVNHDGRSSGLTVPNGLAQQALIREALANAGVNAADIGYLEAHGTGTPLGDPIEVSSLGAVFGPGRAPGQDLFIGSVKTNIGHLEAAAGIAGLIKVVLALQNREIPAHLHLQQLNANIVRDSWPFSIPAQTMPWPLSQGRAIAGVSSFGASGTNAHVVVEAADAAGPSAADPARLKHVLCISAKDEKSLNEITIRFENYFRNAPVASVADACFTSTAGRSHFTHRLAVVGETPADMAEGLTCYLEGRSCTEMTSGVAPVKAHKPAFLFAGQGSVHLNMARKLYETQPVFRDALERCEAILRGRLDIPLLSAIYPDHGEATPLLKPSYAQPALFAIEYALTEMWRAWGIMPAMVLGHSVGEYAAACVAGVLELEDALTLVAERGRLMDQLPRIGGMASVFGRLEDVQRTMAGQSADLSIAAINGPEHIVISGARDALDRVSSELRKLGFRVEPLDVSHAFHSGLMEPVLEPFERTAGRVAFDRPRIAFVSSVSGRAEATAPCDAAYWLRQIREPVRFADGVRALADQGCRLFLEIGPTATLSTMGRSSGPSDATWLTSLRRGREDWEQVLQTVAGLYTRGADIDWTAFHRDSARHRVPLPPYPFSRKRFWKPGIDRPLTKLAQWLYEVQWLEQPKERSGESLPPAHDRPQLSIPAAGDLDRRFSELQTEHGLEKYAHVLPELDALAVGYVVQALLELGLTFEPGRRCSSRELFKVLEVAPEHARLFDRLFEILEQAGFLQRAGDEWEVRRVPMSVDLATRCAALEAKFPDCRVEISLLARCGSQLAAVLTGRADPLELLFGDPNIYAERMYRNASFSRTFNAMVAEAVAAVVRNLPNGQRIRILELGAGTGSTTSEILPVVQEHCSEYLFTDISPHFMMRAEQAFRNYRFVRCQLFDLERSPESQGLSPHTFDVVVAANVLHATSNVTQALRYVRQLTASQGILVLVEGSAPQAWVDLIAGLTKGWWKFEDMELRPSHPLLSGSAWIDLLNSSGFEDVSSIPNGEGGSSQQTLLVARAGAHAPSLQNSAVDASRDLAGTWMVSGEQGELARQIAAGIVASGGKVSLGENGRPVRGVVYLTTGDGVAGTEMQVDRCGAVLRLLQRLRAPTRLWVVTQGVLAGKSFEDAPLWGLGRTAALELPERWGGLLDLDPGVEAAPGAAAVLAELAGGDEDQVAIRGGRRYVARLMRAAASAPKRQVPIRPDATYLVSGGLGGLGLTVARWLVDRGARHLLLIGRHGPADAAQDTVNAMERDGAHVDIACADVADAAALRRVLDDRAAKPPLRGVIHAAGVLSDRTILADDWRNFAEVLRPKIDGAWNLHLLTQDAALDFFVIFSAAAAVLGSAGQANYAAANAFVDALAHHRRAMGLPALSINWGPWSRTGLAAEMDLAHRRRVIPGIGSMAPEQGLAVLERLIAADCAQMTVLPVDWAELSRQFAPGKEPRIFTELLRAAKPEAEDTTRAKASTEHCDFANRLTAAPPGSRRNLLATHVRGEVSRVLGIDGPHQLPNDKGFADLGMDSLMAIELKNRLQTSLGHVLPATLAFDYPTVDALVDFLAREAASKPEASDDRPSVSYGEGLEEAEFIARLEQMSDEEAGHLITGHLIALETRES